jgi:hypothetical protein
MKKLLLISVYIFPFFANALLEMKVGYQMQSGAPSVYNDLLNSACLNCGTKAPPLSGYGFDLVIKIPKIPFGFGIRYDEFQQKTELLSVIKLTQKFSATSLLLNYRFIDKLIFVGPIVTYGIYNQSTLKYELNGVEQFMGTATSATSYTAGVESGVKLGLLRISSEVGYGSYVATDIKNSSNAFLSSGEYYSNKIAYNGPYGRLQLGFGF